MFKLRSKTKFEEILKYRSIDVPTEEPKFDTGKYQ